tara:strand:+ start:1625 stop:2026 length:402 start_codon:yes stop_codon:yes gene_type:complete
MGKSKRVITLKTACVCGYSGATWRGNALYCSNPDCDILIRFKGKNRTEASKPVAIPKGNEASSWNPVASVEQVRSIDANRWPIASNEHQHQCQYVDGVKSSHKVFDPNLAKELFERFGCGNGLICGEDSCTLC